MPDTSLEALPVIFRAERFGPFADDVTAVFPTLPATYDGTAFVTYALIGQHGSGSWGWYQQRTRKAKPAEYAELLAQLRRIYSTVHSADDSPVTLQVCERLTPKHRAQFDANVARVRQANER